MGDNECNGSMMQDGPLVVYEGVIVMDFFFPCLLNFCLFLLSNYKSLWKILPQITAVTMRVVPITEVLSVQQSLATIVSPGVISTPTAIIWHLQCTQSSEGGTTSAGTQEDKWRLLGASLSIPIWEWISVMSARAVSRTPSNHD